ncbi:MAG: tetratricopeptide repeat protein [Deltaproteobacteria bacterium]|nr:tetratricopeptide repeat protein [Deltaproteobacteria bacterium]MDH3382601.1 tetratricopeptide repeat protein [Deltaproteobacteria bacterium]
MKLSSATASYDRDEILRMAEKYRSQRRIRKAIREYEKILSVDRRDIDVHMKIAPLYIRVGRKDQAKDSLLQVISWYEKQGFVEKAIATLRLALTVDRRNLAAHLHLAELYLGKGHPGDARNVLDAARKAFRGKRYLKEAIAVEEKILSLAPDDFPTQVFLVRLLWKTGKRRDALDRLRRMEEQWARRGNKKNWRKTRRLLCRHAPSLSTGWGCFLSFFTAPVPNRPVKKGNPQYPQDETTRGN